MPGVGGQPHIGALRHVRLVQETTFGEVPVAPDWTSLPILEDGFKLKATSERYWGNTNYGGDHRRHMAVHHKLDVAGDLVTLPWPEATLLMLDMALERDASLDLYSYTIDHYTPVDPRRYLGAVAERLTIGFEPPEVRFTLGMRAKLEQEYNALVPGDFDYSGLTLSPFMYAGAEIRINDVLYTHIDSGTLTIENNVAAGPPVRTAGTPLGTAAYLIAQQRAISFESTQLNWDDEFNEAIRDGGLFSLDIRLYHPAGHICQIQVPAMVVEESDEDGTPDQVAKESPRLEALVPSGGTNDIIYAVDLTPTTTLAGLTTTTAPTTTAAATTTAPA